LLAKRLPWPGLLAFLAALGLTVALYQNAVETERSNTRRDFDQAATGRVHALQTEVAQTMELLDLVSRHLELTRGGDLQGFQHFLSPLLARHPYLQSVGYTPRVTAAERSDFERRARADYPDFTINEAAQPGVFTPARERAEYFPFRYAEPLADNRPAIGFDVATEIRANEGTPRHDAMNEALSRNAVAVSAPVTLVLKKASGSVGVLAFSPLYRDGVRDRAHLFGFAVQVIRVGKMLDWAQRTSSERDGKEVTLFLRDISGATPVAMEGTLPATLPELHYNATIAIPGNRQWQATVLPVPGSFSLAPGKGALSLLSAGLVLSLLLGQLVQIQADKAYSIRRQVKARTADLAEANAKLREEIGRRKDSEARLKKVSALQKSVLANAGYAIIATDNDGLIQVFNPAAERILGYSAEAVVNRQRPSLFHTPGQAPDNDGERFRAVVAPLADLPPGAAYDQELSYWTRDGREIPVMLSLSAMLDEDGKQVGYMGISHDISTQKAAETRITRLAHYDPLTDLPNRLFLREELGHAIAAAKRARQQLGIMFVDLDRFKNINDSLGHFVGDALLQAIANRLRNSLREGDLVARMGGDEFVILLNPLEQLDRAAEVAVRIQNQISAPVTIGEHLLTVTPSIGIALYPEDGEDSDSLIQNADTAMYSAKEQGRNGYRFFTRYMNERVSSRLAVESRIRRALKESLFVLHYQPQYAAASGALIGAEALIRMQGEEGAIPPGEFIPVAEDSGLIMPIGDWVLREAARQNKAWLDAGLKAVPIAVNASARQFEQPDFADRVQATLREVGLAPELLEIELTESALMHSVDRALETLHALKAQGLRIAIDDFGTGFSSLAYLRRFPIDRLKIDRSFVADMARDGDGNAIVQAIIGLAHDLHLEVIAEGVESTEQAELLRRWRCNSFQGYLLGRPIAAEDFAALLALKASA